MRATRLQGRLGETWPTARPAHSRRRTGSTAPAWLGQALSGGSVGVIRARVAFRNLSDRRPVGPDPGEAGEGAGLVKREPDIARPRPS